MTQGSLFENRPAIYIARPTDARCHGQKVLRIALDDATEAFWRIVRTRGLGLGHLSATTRNGGVARVQDGDTLLSDDDGVREQWAGDLAAAGWAVVLDGVSR